MSNRLPEGISVCGTNNLEIQQQRNTSVSAEDLLNHYYDPMTGSTTEPVTAIYNISSPESKQLHSTDDIDTLQSFQESLRVSRGRKRSHSEACDKELALKDQSLHLLQTRCGIVLQAGVVWLASFAHAAAKIAPRYSAGSLVDAEAHRCTPVEGTTVITRYQTEQTLWYIASKGQRYAIDTMLRAKRLCVGVRDSVYLGAELAQQAIFSKGNIKVEPDEFRIKSEYDGEIKGKKDNTDASQTSSPDHNPVNKPDDAESIQDFEWNDNPDLNKPIQLSSTESNKKDADSTVKIDKEAQDEPDSSPKSPRKSQRLAVKDSYDDPITKSFAWLGLDEKGVKSLRLQPSTKRQQLRRREREERERKEKEERERLEREAKLKAERLGRVEPPAKSDLFEALSPELEARVQSAFKSPGSKQLSATPEGTELLAMHFQTLKPGQWLNDEIINAAMSIYVDHAQKHFEDRRQDTPTVQTIGSHFYTQMVNKGDGTVAGTHGSVRRWATRKKIGGKSFLDCSLVVTPVNHGNAHWTLLAFWPKQRAVEYYDSFRGSPSQVFAISKHFLQGELGDLYDDSEWSYRVGKSPRQANGYDCGVFACTTAKMLILGYEPEVSYTGSDMSGQRKRIAAELLTVGMEGELQPKFAENWLK